MLNTKLAVIGQNVTKVCTVCEQEKPLTAFSRDKQKADGFYPHCKICNNLNSKNRKKFRKQNPLPKNSACECCGKIKKLVLDHCHKTQQFRGWLCSDCNVALGKLGDNTEGVLKALDYLERKNMLNSHQHGGTDDLAAA